MRKWIIEFIGTARTLLLGVVTFASLLFSGCANRGVGERANASFISPSDQRQNSFGMSEAAESSAIVDWSKPASEQPGYTAPLYGGRADPSSP
jgi:hypothetical protein